MLTLFGTALSAILAGGATGILGMLLQRGFDAFFQYVKAKQDLAMFQAKSAHELAMKDKDAAIMAQEWAGRTKVAETEGNTAKEVASTNAFAGTLLREPERFSSITALTVGQNWLLVILDVVRGAIRPALTIYLCALTSYIWYQVSKELAMEDLDAAQVLSIWLEVVRTVLYLTTTVILWWFGTRNQQPAPSARVVPASRPPAGLPGSPAQSAPRPPNP